MDCSTSGFPVLHQLPEFAQTHVHWVCDAIQPSHPLSSPSPPAFNHFQHQGLFQWVRWPKYWSFSFSISPSSEYLGIISFRIDWFDLLKVQGTLKSLLQHHSLTVSTIQHSAFFMVQLHTYMTTGKTIDLTIWTFCWQSNVPALWYDVQVCYSFSSNEQASFNFMAAVTTCSDFWSPRKYSLSLFPLFPHLFAMKWWDQMPWS